MIRINKIVSFVGSAVLSGILAGQVLAAENPAFTETAEYQAAVSDVKEALKSHDVSQVKLFLNGHSLQLDGQVSSEQQHEIAVQAVLDSLAIYQAVPNGGKHELLCDRHYAAHYNYRRRTALKNSQNCSLVDRVEDNLTVGRKEE